MEAGASTLNFLQYRFSLIPVFFRLRRRPRPWGSVYDSRTKRPLPYTRVEILNDKSRKLESVISDAEGRYGFLTAGKFADDHNPQISLRAEQKGYAFPSKEEPTTNEKTIYPNIYRGGLIGVAGDTVNFDLPMDAAHPEVRTGLGKHFKITSAKMNTALVILVNTMFVTGVIFGVMSYVFEQSLLNTMLIGLILMNLVLRISGFKMKSFGTTKIRGTNKAMAFSFIAIHDMDGQRVSFTVSDELGRYFLLAPKGDYVLKAYTPAHISPMRTTEVSISTKRGWINQEVEI
jgi:hypothetical protein